MKKTVKKTFYQTESVINKKIIAIFLASFVISLIVLSGIFRMFNNKNKSNIQSKPEIGKTITKIISKVVKPKYNYFESKKPTIDPVMVKELIDSSEKSYIIIDIRSADEYKQKHIKGAINIPSYSDPKNIYQSLTNKNQELNKQSKKLIGKKLIVVYGYHPEADITYDMVEFFKKMGITVRILNISWYEWGSNFYSWMPSGALINFSINNYLEGVEMELIKQ